MWRTAFSASAFGVGITAKFQEQLANLAEESKTADPERPRESVRRAAHDFGLEQFRALTSNFAELSLDARREAADTLAEIAETMELVTSERWRSRRSHALGFSDRRGGAVWGSTAAVDNARKTVYITTGNNYTAPQSALDCVDAATTPEAKRACLPVDDYFDSVLALDAGTGAVKWVTQALPFDAWNVDCIPFFGDGSNCPEPAGPDYDFGQGPALFTVKAPGGKPRDLVGAGQKSGQYWALDADTGAVAWVTQTGPGGTAGGLQWGSAVDGTRIYTANANSDRKPWELVRDGVGTRVTTNQGIWSALDAATGKILWQTVPPNGGGASGPATTANGVVYGCALDPVGHMVAMNAATGSIQWDFASGGSCLSGGAISQGTIYWGSGYSNFGFGTPNNKLYAFSLNGS